MNADTIKDLIYQAAAQAMSGDAIDGEAEALQSIIGLVHTLIEADKAAELMLMLSVTFSNYFNVPPLVLLYPPINEN